MNIALMNQHMHAEEHCTQFSALDNEMMNLIKEKYNNEIRTKLQEIQQQK